MKNILKTTAILLILAGSLISCDKDEYSIIKAKETIVDYIKCLDYEGVNMVFGLSVITEKKDSLLAYNIPHETLNELLDTDIDDFGYGNHIWGHLFDNLHVTFEYRKAKEDEIVNVVCGQFFMFPSYKHEELEQIIISNINK
jgi:hypothetical protein